MRDGKIERAIKITFDDFLKPVVEAWRAGEPYTDIFFKIPEYEVDSLLLTSTCRGCTGVLVPLLKATPLSLKRK